MISRLFAASVLLVTLLTACSNKRVKPGIWFIQGVENLNTGETTTPGQTCAHFDLRADNTLGLTLPESDGMDIQGNWKEKGDTLVIKAADDEPISFAIIFANDVSLALKNTTGIIRLSSKCKFPMP